jgi:hypothetical protein
MNNFILFLFIIVLCIYLYNCNSNIINNENFDNLNLFNKPHVNINLKSYNDTNNIPNVEYDKKYWNIKNDNYSLLDNGFINKKYNTMINNKELGNDIIDKSLTNYNDKDNDIIIESGNNEYPPKDYYYNNKKYNLFGLGSNPFNNIYVIIYEREINNENNIHNNKLYEYILVKKQYNNINVIQVFQPRNKITIGESVNLSFGSSKLSYILVSQIN